MKLLFFDFILLASVIVPSSNVWYTCIVNKILALTGHEILKNSSNPFLPQTFTRIKWASLSELLSGR